MSTSTLSSLGLGSDSVLTYDLIDSLRAVDEEAQLDPIDEDLATNSTQQTDLETLTTLASALQTSASALADDTYYLQRTTTVSDEAITVTADGGTNVQDFTLHVEQLAQQDIYQSTGFSSETSAVTTASDTLTIEINGTSYSFAVSSSTTITDLADMINDKLDGNVTASILNTGGDTPYKLILKSDDTGADYAITLSSTNYESDPTSTNILSSLGWDDTDSHIQTAQDASFTYNGVSITRSSNTVDDLIVGVTITLNEVQDTGDTTSVSIEQDWTDIKTQIESFVSAFNSLVSNLDSATSYDAEEETAGVFQGVSQLTGFLSSIKQQVQSLDENGRSLLDYGLTFEDGTLSFDEDTFDEKVEDDPDDVQDFFMGSTTHETTTYTGTSIASGALSITYKGLYINDTSIRFTTDAGSTAEENAVALQKAINEAGVEGVTATVGSDGNIILKSTTGSDIEITGDATVLSTLGLKQTMIYGHSTTRDGMFTEFEDLLETYTDDSEGILTVYSEYLDTRLESLTEQREKLVESLDTKYEIMATKFAAYDSMISEMTTSFDTLSMMIDESSSD
ncbi:flagellar filament capping protein FliD [Sulfurospirillum halorespirans]|uniref:Flagellar hook-associated protein 2 n=1 Tax=Sulfurospirillum halorespirans DSM 13726 TaxID=1193502 RepID=A0A1D7TJG4_9BACT|nr:flagellar filament capping protein FliD [Sulfurospirillum halorespirans]AOO65137.1 flagellar hook-associated protein FliD [Sulfurospirillum halorespirans DSM 13726]